MGGRGPQRGPAPPCSAGRRRGSASLWAPGFLQKGPRGLSLSGLWEIKFRGELLGPGALYFGAPGPFILGPAARFWAPGLSEKPQESPKESQKAQKRFKKCRNVKKKRPPKVDFEFDFEIEYRIRVSSFDFDFDFENPNSTSKWDTGRTPGPVPHQIQGPRGSFKRSPRGPLKGPWGP